MVKSKGTSKNVPEIDKVNTVSKISSTASPESESKSIPVRLQKTYSSSNINNTELNIKTDSDENATEPTKQVEHIKATTTLPAENKHVKFEDVPNAKIEATITIEDSPEHVMSRSKAVKDMNADTSVVIDSKETYFERLAQKESENKDSNVSATDAFHVNMTPEIIEETAEISERFAVPKTAGKFDTIIVPTEQLKQPAELEKGMCQYYVAALYILDSVNKKKYMQGSIITLPDDVEKMPRIFKTCVKGGRLVRCDEISKKVNRQKQMYDSRARKWVKEGTPEYEAYKAYMEEKQAKITARNEQKIAEERKRLGID